jgi:molybdopterin-guanine dinucleotide biosynthesis protein B
MKVIAVVGLSGSGKTRLVVRLIRELKGRGLRVSALKRCSHDFSLDTEGKDTAAFSAAGAEGVAMVSQEGWAAIVKATVAPDPASLADRLFPDADVVLVEGGKDVRGTRKIEVLRAGVSGTPLSRPNELVAVVADLPVPGGAVAPVFGPDDVSGIADLILSLEEAKMADIMLEVDGREVNMNPFVRTFIERTVLGMVTSLSGIDPEPKKITLVIDRTGDLPKGGGKP